MKLLLVIISFCFCTLHLSGQSGVMTHLFKDKSVELNPFVNPTFQYSQIALQYCSIPGIRAGVMINNRLLIGGVYNFTLGDLTLPASIGVGKLQMKWGGGHLEYTLWPLQIVHLTIPLSVGIGQMKITESTNETLTGQPNFFFAEPGWMVEVNAWRYAKLGIGVSYRYTRRVSYNSITKNDLNGFSAVASVKFGIFNDSNQKKNLRDPIETETETKVKLPHVKKRKSPR